MAVIGFPLSSTINTLPVPVFLFFSRYADWQTAQEQGWADAVLGDDNLGILAQGGFNHLHLLKGLGVADEVFLRCLVNQADGFSLALGYLNRSFTLSLRTLNYCQLLLFGSLELTSR